MPDQRPKARASKVTRTAGLRAICLHRPILEPRAWAPGATRKNRRLLTKFRDANNSDAPATAVAAHGLALLNHLRHLLL
jgi:hypothetical protein